MRRRGEMAGLANTRLWLVEFQALRLVATLPASSTGKPPRNLFDLLVVVVVYYYYN